MNLNELPDISARRWPQKAAFVENSTTVSYATLAERIGSFAATLKTLQWAPEEIAEIAVAMELSAALGQKLPDHESRVFGRVHPHLGEAVEAEIVLAGKSSTTEDLPRYCREQLAAFKIPTCFHIVPALLRTPVTGKIRRTAVVA